MSASLLDSITLSMKYVFGRSVILESFSSARAVESASRTEMELDMLPHLKYMQCKYSRSGGPGALVP